MWLSSLSPPAALIFTLNHGLANGKRSVTGAGGGLGSHLVERLVELGARVRALARYNCRNDWGLLEMLPASIKNEIDVILGDLTDPHSTTRLVQGQEIIFPLAALIAIPYS